MPSSSTHRRPLRRPGRRTVAVALLAATAAGTSAGLAQAAFTDVESASVHAEAIGWLEDNGISLGCDVPGSYCPGEPLTREEAASLLYRLSGQDPSTPASVDAATVGGLTAGELAGQPGPAGEPGPTGGTGPTGDTGPAGADGVSGREQSSGQRALATGEGTSLIVPCTPGSLVLGGGYETTGGIVVTASYPLVDENGWLVQAANPGAAGVLTVHGICADVA